MLSADRNILNEGSEAHLRMRDYGSVVDELHVIVKNQKSKIKNQSFGNVFIYPTNTCLKPLYFWDAYKIASKIIGHWSLVIGHCVVTAQNPFETGLIGYWLKRRFKMPLQIQVHTDFLSPYFWRESVKNKIRVVLGKWIIRKADGVRVVSERIKKSLVIGHWSLRDKIFILPIFVDAEKIEDTPVKVNLHHKYPGYDFIILAASRLTREKNIGLAIEAMAEVVKDFPKTLLLMVGDGSELKNLQLTTHNLQLGNNVKFEPWTNELFSYYKTADLFLLTSNYEGYGRTVIEAAAAGLPVLMTDVGVAIGRVVGVGDRNGLVEKILEIIGNPESRQRVLGQQNKFLENWPTKLEYLSKIEQSWQECFL